MSVGRLLADFVAKVDDGGGEDGLLMRWSAICCTGSGIIASDAPGLRGIYAKALQWVLRIKRTLTGAEIDDLIANTCAGFKLVAERRRRADWQRTVAKAAKFEAEKLAT